MTLGGAGYVPVPADYDGDGLADPTVKSDLPSPAVAGYAKAGASNEWMVMLSAGGYTLMPLMLSFE